MNITRTQEQSESDGDGATGADRDLSGADEDTAEQVRAHGSGRSAVRGRFAVRPTATTSDAREGEALYRWKRCQLVKPFELATQLVPSMGSIVDGVGLVSDEVIATYDAQAAELVGASSLAALSRQ